MGDFVMPSLGADMDEGTVLEWLVGPGDQVRKGDVVAVVDTAKSAVDVETFESGVVERILVEPGTRVAVGTPLAVIGAAASAEPAEPEVPAKPAKLAKPRIAPERKAPPKVKAAPTPTVMRASPVVRRFARQVGVDLAATVGTGPDGRVTHADVQRAAAAVERPRVTPYARRRARELGVDLAGVPGAGRVVRGADVEAAAVAAPAVPAPRERAVVSPAQPSDAERSAAMRRAIAGLMARSKREVPHYYLTDTVDLTPATAWLRRHNENLPVAQRVVMAALFCKATALAARKVPELNGFFVDDAFRPADGVHLGVAVSLRGGGLVTPAIHDADTLTVPDMMAALRDLVERARRGVLHRRELVEGTLTITNLGERGAESVLGVIFPPQVGLVGFGRVVDTVRAVDGLVGVRPSVTVSLSGDHRVTDGHRGGVFVDTVRTLLEHPEDL